MIRVGSLFSGIGGFELGLALSGIQHELVWQCEIEPKRRAVLARNFPSVRCYNDVREIDEQAESVDLICGGFPCQDISQAGKRRGIKGARSGLWFEFLRCIRVLRPRLVLLENVPRLDRYLGDVLGPLAALGFDAEWVCIRACDVGASQRRERIFALAYNGEIGRCEFWPRDNDYGGYAYGKLADGCDPILCPPPGPEDEAALQAWIKNNPSNPPWIRRDSGGLSGRVDRVKALGDSIHPLQACHAIRELFDRAESPHHTECDLDEDCPSP